MQISHNSVRPEIGSLEFDDWLEKESLYCVFDESIASDDEYFSFWYEPSLKLDCELLSKVYEVGFKSSNMKDLNQLEIELQTLVGYWQANPKSRDLIRLLERASHLMEGIKTARELDANLLIS